MKKLTKFLCIAIALFSMGFIATACGGNKTITVDDFKLKRCDDGYSIVGYVGTDTDVILPSSYKGTSVVMIDEEAFSFNTTIKNITISSNIKYIYDQAFHYCTNLESVTFAADSQIEKIERLAFANCANLNEITIPLSVYFVGASAFQDCNNLTIYCETEYWQEAKPDQADPRLPYGGNGIDGWNVDWNVKSTTTWTRFVVNYIEPAQAT